jgi:hypothetical protein
MAAELPIASLEAISRGIPGRVLRLRGRLGEEPYELLIFRGFSSSTTHPTGSDPDQPVLPAAVEITTAELLQAPLTPAAEVLLAGPAPVECFLESAAWS